LGLKYDTSLPIVSGS